MAHNINLINDCIYLSIKNSQQFALILIVCAAICNLLRAMLPKHIDLSFLTPRTISSSKMTNHLDVFHSSTASVSDISDGPAVAVHAYDTLPNNKSSSSAFSPATSASSFNKGDSVPVDSPKAGGGSGEVVTDIDLDHQILSHQLNLQNQQRHATTYPFGKPVFGGIGAGVGVGAGAVPLTPIAETPSNSSASVGGMSPGNSLASATTKEAATLATPTRQGDAATPSNSLRSMPTIPTGAGAGDSREFEIDVDEDALRPHAHDGHTGTGAGAGFTQFLDKCGKIIHALATSAAVTVTDDHDTPKATAGVLDALEEVDDVDLDNTLADFDNDHSDNYFNESQV